jgi:hypothetical protein
MTTRRRITKRKPSKNKSRQRTAQRVKVEENTDTKSLLQSSSKLSELTQGQQISQEQINRLIHAIVDDNMSIAKASRKAKISSGTASYYYNTYKNDSEKKIPSPRTRFMNPKRTYTQEHIANLIGYIDDDNMTVSKASEKAGMTYVAGRYYYHKYLEDPDNNIPIPYNGQACTQEQKEAFIGFIVNDKISIRAAAKKKTNMDSNTAKKACRIYFNGENPIIPAPSHIAPYTYYTQEQITEVIGYIVNDKMSIPTASKKVNVCPHSARRHHRQYLIDSNMELPVPKDFKSYTQEEKDQLISFIVDEKMSIIAASKKVSMNYHKAQKYYQQYVKNQNLDTSRYTQGQINQLIGYIVDDKMNKTEAARKENIPYDTANKC